MLLLSLKEEFHAHGQCARLYCCYIYGLFQAGCFLWDAYHRTFHSGYLLRPFHWLCAPLCWGNLPHISPWSIRHSASAWSSDRHSHGTGKIFQWNHDFPFHLLHSVALELEKTSLYSVILKLHTDSTRVVLVEMIAQNVTMWSLTLKINSQIITLPLPVKKRVSWSLAATRL